MVQVVTLGANGRSTAPVQSVTTYVLGAMLTGGAIGAIVGWLSPFGVLSLTEDWRIPMAHAGKVRAIFRAAALGAGTDTATLWKTPLAGGASSITSLIASLSGSGAGVVDKTAPGDGVTVAEGDMISVAVSAAALSALAGLVCVLELTPT